MTLTLLPQHLDSYTLWLKNRQYQSNTIRNYLQDLKTYLTFSQNQISKELISEYFKEVSLKNNSSRYLASISIFCQFLLNQHLTDTNLFKQVKKHLARQPSLDLEKLLTQYESFLLKDHKSDLTIKNYLNDIHQYFDWLNLNSAQNPSTSISTKTSSSEKENFTPPKKHRFINFFKKRSLFES